MRIHDALDLFEIQLRADGRSHHTRAQYRRHVTLFASWAATDGLGDDASAVGHEDIASFLSSPTAQRSAHGGTKMSATSNALRTSVRCFFRYLHQAGHVTEDPARLVRRANCGTAPPRALADDDRDRILRVLNDADDAAGRRDGMLIRLLLGIGLRIGSAISLDVEDIDFGRGELRVRTAKGGRPIDVVMSRAVGEDLRAYLGDRRSGPVFLARGGRRVSIRHVQRRFDELQTRAAVQRRITLHGLRHSFAISIYEKTRDLLLTQRAMGHRSITSTTIYARVSDDHLRQVLDA